MNIKNILKFIVAIVVSEMAGVVGSFFTAPNIDPWYESLAKPALNPPAWIFGPVWITLYFLMGVALFIVWKKYPDMSQSRRLIWWRVGVGIFGLQLVLNAFWSVIFFGWHNPGAALIELIFLWLVILATIIVFARISRLAAWLLIPYILWVSFALYLNFEIWRMIEKESQTVYCTQDAKLCPDGTYVGRVGPNCEFKLCPGETE